MDKYKYQRSFSQQHKELYNISERQTKAKKIISVLRDYFRDNLNDKKLLDIGCSTGIITSLLAEKFRKTIGIDIDDTAIKYANENYGKKNVIFEIGDAMQLKFSDNEFDVVNCAHIYEHVPNANILMKEIFRVLKPNGICFFAAGNRIILIESHYNLPFLSLIPKKYAHKYLKILGKGDFYYENHLTLYGLKKLVSEFDIIDYTKDIIRNPEKYHAEDMITNKSLKQKIILLLLNTAYWLCPTYIWLLRKPIKTIT